MDAAFLDVMHRIVMYDDQDCAAGIDWLLRQDVMELAVFVQRLLHEPAELAKDPESAQAIQKLASVGLRRLIVLAKEQTAGRSPC